MGSLEKSAVIAALIWAVTLIILQVLTAKKGSPRQFNQSPGPRWRAVLYNFTGAMNPDHKETIKKHPVKFSVGMIFHAGIAIAFLKAALIVIGVSQGMHSVPVAGPGLFLAILSGIFLLTARSISPYMKKMSSPEDYFSICLSIVFLLVAIMHEASILRTDIFLWSTAIVLFYLPLGKLRHAFLFYIVRSDYAMKLGSRGIYPPAQKKSGKIRKGAGYGW